MTRLALLLLIAGTPALAHHEAGVTTASPFGLTVGLALIAISGLLALLRHKPARQSTA